MSSRFWICAFLLALLAHAWPATAAPATHELRADFCAAVAPAGPPATATTLGRMSFACGAVELPPYRDRWLWLKLGDATVLRDMPAGWQLLVDQTRFDRIAVVVTTRDASATTLRSAGGLAQNFAPGGLIRFTVARSGLELTGLYIGFERPEDISLMRKVTAASPAQAASRSNRWLVLMGVFTGALLCAFTYNLLIYTGQRYAFQRWYLVWAAVAFAYGLTWTNMAAFVVPGLTGPSAVRADYVLIGAMVGAGNMFFISVLEAGMLPRWLILIGRWLAAFGLAAGIVAAMDHVFPPAATDRLLSWVILAAALLVFSGICTAIARGSRIVWFYLAGWAPVLCVFAMRLARNFGLLPQDDMVDMATFGVVAWESMVLSLAIADRFRLLRRERDIAEQSRQSIEIESETLRRAAQTDFLTGLGNRAAFQGTMQTLAERGGFALFLADVDNLKDINDRLGHDGGDALLAHVGMRLAEVAGSGAFVSRIGGDEFGILVGSASLAEQAVVARALEDVQGERWVHGGRSWSISLSIGAAQFPDDASRTDALYKNADLALYHAKQQGRRRLHRYDPSLQELVDRKSGFVRDAYAGLDRGEFIPNFQQIIDLKTDRCAGNEVLLRWDHPKHGVMTPATFGDILVDSDVAMRIQDHVLDRALAELSGASADGPYLSVNFTADQLRGPQAALRLLDKLSAAKVPTRRLCIELTEGVVLERVANDTVAALRLLHDAGVRIALDDFGTGYASLLHLKQMPIDILKIDKSFVVGLLDDGGQSEEIVRAIIGLGHGLKMTTVAEGIETDAQRVRLRDLGCDLGQGHLFAKAEPVLSVEAYPGGN